VKITRITDDTLVLDEKPWFLGMVFIALILGFAAAALDFFANDELRRGFVFLGCAAFVFWFFYRYVVHTQVIFERCQNLIRLRRTSIRGRTETTLPLDRVQGAVVETDRTSEQDRHRVALVLISPDQPRLALALSSPDTHRPLSETFTPGPEAKSLAETINTWLARRP